VKRHLASAVGLLIGGAGIAFIVRTLWRNRAEVGAALSALDPWLALVALLLGVTAMVQIGLAWRRALAIVGERRPVVDTLYRYYVGQLGKYVPGGIWPVVGRAEMARRGGVGAGAAYSSTVLSLATTYLGAMAVAVATLPFALDGQRAQRWVLLLLPLGVLALHPRVIALALSWTERLTGRRAAVTIPSWGTSARLLARHVPAWLAIGLATWTVAAALGDAGTLGNVVFATTLSWVVGFLIIPVPGGVGVRETVFVAAATSLPSGLAAATAVTARLVFIAVDVSGAAVTAALVRRRARASGSGTAPRAGSPDVRRSGS
jgi:glycosyltransferase 2 family protein